MRRLLPLMIACIAALLIQVTSSKGGALSVQTIYAPSPPTVQNVTCGSTIISQWDYWPQQNDSTYTIKFKARAYTPTILYLILPDYEQSLTLPPDGAEHPYILTVTTPPYTGHDSLQIVFGADVSRPCRGTDKLPPGLVVRSINLQIGH